MTYRYEVPGTDRDILLKIGELRVLRSNIDKHIKVLQAAHSHSDIESGGDQRDGYFKRCKQCGASL